MSRSVSILFGLLLLAAAWSPSFANEREPVLKQVEVPHSYYWREMYIPHLTSGPSSLAWTPDGKSLVYSMQGRLWRQRIGSTSPEQLTTGGGYDYQPDVSPDGKRVVFTRYQNDAMELVIRNLRSGRETAVTQNGAVNLDPRWAPDGKRIAYVTTVGSGKFHIAIATNENGVWKSARWAPERVSKTPRYYYSQTDHELSPAWSPDGESLVFVANPEIGYGSGSVWRQRVDRSAPAELLVSEETAWRTHPDWSPDGKRIAYSSFLGRQWHQLWMTTAAPGGYPLPFSYGEFDVTAVRWSPDGKRVAYVSNEKGDGAIWIQEVVGGAKQRLNVEQKRYSSPVGGLQLRILDENGAPVAARVSVKGADGRYYAPNDAMIHADDSFDREISKSETMYFHSAGESFVVVPPGKTEVTIWRGMRDAVQHLETAVEGGKTALQTVNMTALPNAEAFADWRSADVHVHMNYGGVYRMTPEKLSFQSEAEDLDLAFNLVVNKEQRIPDINYFSTSPMRVDGSPVVIVPAQEYHTSLWGHLGLIGLKDHFLLGDYTAYPKTALHSYYPDNATVADLAHAQSALVGYVHPYDPPVPDPFSDARLTHTLPVDVALGKVDYVEILGFSDHRTTESVWRRLLNCGFRLPAAGGTDAMTNYSSLRGPIGMNRTFVKMDKTPDDPEVMTAAWLAGLKAGRSFATNGPLVKLTVEGHDPGDEIKLGKGAHQLSYEVTMTSIAPVDSLDLIVNGETVAIPLSEDKRSATYSGTLNIDKSGWITARAAAKGSSPLIFDGYPFATTSPVYVTVGGRPVRSREDADYFIAWIEKLETVAGNGEYNTDEERNAVLSHLRQAKREFEKRR